ncbi:hypothetical protein WN48_11279 [Eufriesea mexicana]|uniref:Uncharacterized protein n=1 Tax=Eufriesea mexicana TaxID=516756 RepID=A0A310S9P6_9HYME|nr:hypothetical protein WN48_11279 [Eufriesea mexicana]
MVDYFDGTGNGYDRWEMQVRILRTGTNCPQNRTRCWQGVSSSRKGPGVVPIEVQTHRYGDRRVLEEAMQYVPSSTELSCAKVAVQREKHGGRARHSASLQDQAYMHKFQTKTDLLDVFEKVSWQNRNDVVEKKIEDQDEQQAVPHKGKDDTFEWQRVREIP